VNVRRSFKVILELARMQLSSSMVYRFSFWGAFLGDLVLFLIQLLFFGVITRNGSIGDWNIYHLTVFVGTFIALDGFYMATYFFGTIGLPYKIQSGGLDLAIVKPVNTLIYVTFGNLNMGSFGLGFVGLGISFYGGVMLGAITAAAVLQYLVILSLMYWLMYALMLCLRCASFWLVKTNAFNEMENTMVDFSFKLPAPAIQGGWKIILFIVLPYGLMANMPAKALFGSFGAAEWTMSISTCILFMLLALGLWKLGMSRYDSASS
jgi:ABC-2 type transport system permease protein